MRAVKRHPDFERDFIAQLDWLSRRGFTEWIVALREGLTHVTKMVSKVPGAGTLVDTRRGVVLRKVFWPEGPYLAWYVYDPADRRGDVWLVRLFHARQRRPKPTPGRWLPRRR